MTGNDHPLLGSYPAVWQLVYAGPDQVIDPPSLDNSANGWVSGDDVVLAVRNIPLGGGTAPEDGTMWETWLYWLGGEGPTYVNMSWVTNGFVYQRMYEGPPGPESWYLNSPLLALNVGWNPMESPQEFWLDSLFSGVKPDQQITSSSGGQTTLILNSGMQHLIRYDYEFPESSRTLNALIGQQVPPGSQFITMDVANQVYWPTITQDREGSWGPRGTTTLARGVAYWLRIPPVGGLVTSNQYVVTMSGTTPTTNTTQTVQPSVINPLGYPYPVDRAWTSTAMATAIPNLSMVWFWDSAGGGLTMSQKSAKGAWMGLALTKQLQTGEGYFLQIPGSTPLNVVEPLP